MNKTCPFSLKPEYVDEMTIDAATEHKHKVICVRMLLRENYTEEEFARYCALYGIDSKQAKLIIRDLEITRFRDVENSKGN